MTEQERWRSYSVMVDLEKLAAIGIMQPPESKFNEVRARWLLYVLSQKGLMWDSCTYFQAELEKMPDYIKNKVEGAAVK